MTTFKCPCCGSSDVSVERRPDGFGKCMVCSYAAKHTEFRVVSDKNLQRGDVYWLTLPCRPGAVQFGTRPAIVVSNNHGNNKSNIVTIVPLTSKDKPNLPTHTYVEVGDVQGTVLCEQVQTVSKDIVGDFIGVLDTNTMFKVNDALAVALGLDCKYSSMAKAKRLANIDVEKVDEQIELCKGIRDQMEAQLTILERLLTLPSPALKTYENRKASPNDGKRTYVKRSREETLQFLKDWVDSPNQQDVADVYGFKTKGQATQFYLRWKDRL